MNAIYFPFTYLKEEDTDRIRTYFPEITMYTPAMESVSLSILTLSEQGKIRIHQPIQKDEKRLFKAYSEYMEWAKTNRGRTMDTLKHRSGDPYLFDATWSSQIKSDIQKASRRKTDAQPDPDFAARLFLLIAQTFDQNQNEMNRNLQSIEDMENNLFHQLRPDTFEDLPGGYESLSPGAPDPGIYMTRERLVSWYRLLAADKQLLSSLFITTSPEIWELLLEFAPEAELLVKGMAVTEMESSRELESLSVWQKKKWKKSVIDSQQSAITDLVDYKSGLTAIIIPDTPPNTFFSRFAKETEQVPENDSDSFSNTIIGIIQ